jgi:hypothetical protein
MWYAQAVHAHFFSPFHCTDIFTPNLKNNENWINEHNKQKETDGLLS